jgi:hypothetical protein
MADFGDSTAPVTQALSQQFRLLQPAPSPLPWDSTKVRLPQRNPRNLGCSAAAFSPCSRLWRFRYRFQGKERTLSLGRISRRSTEARPNTQRCKRGKWLRTASIQRRAKGNQKCAPRDLPVDRRGVARDANERWRHPRMTSSLDAHGPRVSPPRLSTHRRDYDTGIVGSASRDQDTWETRDCMHIGRSNESAKYSAMPLQPDARSATSQRTLVVPWVQPSPRTMQHTDTLAIHPSASVPVA